MATIEFNDIIPRAASSGSPSSRSTLLEEISLGADEGAAAIPQEMETRMVVCLISSYEPMLSQIVCDCPSILNTALTIQLTQVQLWVAEQILNRAFNKEPIL